MPVAPSERGILGRVGKKVHELKQGFSEGDLKRARGILDGSIEIDDKMRERYKQNQIARVAFVFNVATNGSFGYTGIAMPNDSLFTSEILAAYQDAVRGINKWPDEEIDLRIRADAHEKLDIAAERKRQGAIFP